VTSKQTSTPRPATTSQPGPLHGASTNGAKPYVLDVREEAVRAFRARNSGLHLAPVVVVIAAYNEEDCIADVLGAMPSEACGLAVDTLVVDDGSADRTSEVTLGHGMHVARLGRNCGQGAALQTGYQIAREHGARYIVTLDADGQWPPADIPRVLDPVVSGEADIVLGSRVLGHTETSDHFRRAGVHVFAMLVRLLTGAHVTDTSSGLRAMRSEVTATVRQNEPQYQASELLIGAVCQGYRFTERPVVMQKRVAGQSKKGHNLFYGLSYARVILRTWWRERRDANRAETVTKLGAR
jgi:glycosyltransferase involved in cell wall biosynthesis